MASASVAVVPRPRLRVGNRSGLSDSSNTHESGSSSAFSSARESNLPTGCRPVPTIALSTPPLVPTRVEQSRKSVALGHRQGRQALDLTRDKPLPDIPASPTIQPVRRSLLPSLGRYWLICRCRCRPCSPKRPLPLRPCLGSSHSEALSNLYDGDVQTGQSISIQPTYRSAGSPVPHLLPTTTSPRTPSNHNPT
jgi:hypothetical protein